MTEALLPTYNRAPLAFTRGEGCWLEAEDGRRYLDLMAGIGVNALGHAHSDLVRTLTEQGSKVWHVSNVFRIPEQERLAEMLVDRTFADRAFICNSGTEACELAVKMARRHWWAKDRPDRIRFLAFEGSFHGRSAAAIAAAGAEKLTKGFGPLLPGFTHLTWGDHDALKAALREPDVGAIIVEPVQGEGGIRPMPDVCLKGLREICDETGVLMILDEVQCGMGRTGRLFAHEWAGVRPDIVMVAKGIGGGFPLGAVLATEEAAAAMTVGTHGSTYGGNPLACAVGATVLGIISDPAFLAEVNRKAARLRQGLEALAASHPGVIESVRGQGLMLGLRLTGEPPAFVAAGQANGVLVAGASDRVVRLLPPLVISDEEIDEALRRLDATAASLSGRAAA